MSVISFRRSGAAWSGLVARFVLSSTALVIATFGMLHLTDGDAVRAALGLSANPRLVAERRRSLGLDRPLLVQFWRYVTGLASGRLGTSNVSGEPVRALLSHRIDATFSLAFWAILLAVAVAFPAGITAAAWAESNRFPMAGIVFDSLAAIFSAIPEFLLAVGLVFVFGVTLSWFDVAGQGGAATYVLPVLALASGPTAVLARIVRRETLRVLEQEYIRLARSKRLSATRIYFRHAFPNILAASLTVSGLLFGGLIAGTVLVEQVFDWPGLGATFVDAVTSQDYPVAQAIVLVFGGAALLVNTCVDLTLALMGPARHAL